MKLAKSTASIRSHLSFMLLLGAGLLVAAMALFLDLAIREFLQRRFDQDLFHRAQGIIALVQMDEEGIEFDFVPEHMPEFTAGEGTEFFEIRNADGSLFAKSPSLGDQILKIPARAGEKPVYGNQDLARGQVRYLMMSFHPVKDSEDDEEDDEDHSAAEDGARQLDGEPDEVEDESEQFATFGNPELPGAQQVPMTLILLREGAEFESFLTTLRWLIVSVSGAVLVLLLLLVQLALGKGLQPLAEVQKQVMAIEPGRGDMRVRLRRSVLELDPVIQQLNALLDRLQLAANRERRFTSDVAHELRTPLAELRTLSEVARKDPHDPEAVMQFFEDVREISLEMQALVTNLLELSRCDSGYQKVVLNPMGVSDLWVKLQRRFPVIAPQLKALEKDPLSGNARILSDHILLEHILGNLIQNAIVHGPSPAAIRISQSQNNDCFKWELSNPAPNLRNSDMAHIFDRFWQKDAARTGGKSSGLGLALVASFCAALGIGLQTELTEGVFSVTLEIPTASPGVN